MLELIEGSIDAYRDLFPGFKNSHKGRMQYMLNKSNSRVIGIRKSLDNPLR